MLFRSISVLIEYDCDGSGTYETLFEGIINLASYKEDGEYTYVNIEKSDLLTKLMSRSEISVDLETATSIGGEAITPITPKTIPLSPIEVDFKSKWVIEAPYEQESVRFYDGTGTDGAEFNPAMRLLQGDFTTSNQVGEFSILGNILGYIPGGFSGTPLAEFNDLGIDYPKIGRAHV